jgi:hypothetical protein
MGKGSGGDGGNLQDKARYYPPEIIPFSFGLVCLEIVLKRNEKEKKPSGFTMKFWNVINYLVAWKLPVNLSKRYRKAKIF